MQLIRTRHDLRKKLNASRADGRSVALVPTMGFLHAGHLSLIRRARQENDVVVVSIFVNPTQFAPHEDLEAYPRDTQRDTELMAAEDVDIAFFPAVEEIYPRGFGTFVTVEGTITQVLCAKSRPTHFRGVTTVVSKLFHLIAPDRAYFGQKDAQQVAVIQKMVQDLDFDLEIVVCPIIREADGLAMSSRNANLSPRHRTDAVVLSRSLREARRMIAGGERDPAVVIRHMKRSIRAVPDAEIDYAAVVDARTLADKKPLEGEILVAVAVKFGTTRLIDNLCLTV
jgi:pantoate--beta-alanine ligase